LLTALDAKLQRLKFAVIFMIADMYCKYHYIHDCWRL